MIKRRFFLSTLLSQQVTMDGNEAHHLLHVLRQKVGDEVVIVDIAGQAAIATITSIDQGKAMLTVLERLSEAREAPITVVLAQGLTKSDKMDYIVQKSTELGITAVIPMAADESVVKYDITKQQSRQRRWQKIASEAAKQCHRNTIPDIGDVQMLEQVLEDAKADTNIMMFYEGDTPLGIKQALTDSRPGSYLIIVGPEGGFSAREVALAKAKGVQLVTMGPRILRTETAAIAAVSIVMYHHGDLGG